MQFTSGEMLCFNSLLDGKKIHGIKLNCEDYFNKESYIQEILKGLQEKKFLTNDFKINELGVLPIKLLESYKKAKKYVTIDRIVVSLIDKDYCVALFPITEGEKTVYEMTLLSNNAIIYALLALKPDLRNKYRPFKIASKIPYNHEKTMEDLMQNKPEKMMYLKKEVDNQTIVERIYYWEEEKGYYFDAKENVRMEMETGEIRKTLLDIFEIMEE